MRKQQYILELSKSLSFMTPWDRDAIIDEYSQKFEQAGPEGEEELIEELGTPTKVAVTLHAAYEPTPEGIVAEEISSEEIGQEPVDTAPELTAEDIISEFLTGVPLETLGPEPDVESFVPIDAPEPPPVEEKPLPPVHGKAPGGRTALFAALCVLPGVPLACLVLAACLILLAPGLAVINASVHTAIAGVWAMSYLADGLLLFGAALVALAVGLPLLWLGVWVDARIIKGASSVVRRWRDAVIWKGEDR